MSEARKVLVVGEAMLELRADGDNYTGRIAGDVYNTAVYLKRLAGEAWQVDFLTALGDDPVSERMKHSFTREGVGLSQVRELSGAAPGLYLITLDAAGERSFTYWRSASAARRMLEDETLDGLAARLSAYDLVYFSGITLAILPPADADLLIEAARAARAKGTQIAFDPNYRKRLWSAAATARGLHASACAVSNIVLAGMEDEEALYGDTAPAVVIERLSGLGVPHIVLKAGTDGIYLVSRQQDEAMPGNIHLPVIPAETVVDTTAAGDSFAAGWLYGHLAGQDTLAAARLAASLARFVITQPGAIAPREAFDQWAAANQALTGNTRP